MRQSKVQVRNSAYDMRLERFRDIVGRIEHYRNTAGSLVYWDKITYMPPGGIEYRSKILSFLADEQYKLLSGKEFTGHVRYFSGNRKNSALTDAMLHRISRSSAFINRIPEDEYRRYVELIAIAEQVWAKAKEAGDFEIFRPYLEDIVETFRSFAEYWGYERSPYDALLDYYEEGLSSAQLDGVLEELKSFLIASAKKLSRLSGERQTALPQIDWARQQQVWQVLLKETGFDLDRGRVDLGSHTTVLSNSPSDVRIVNSFNEKGFISGVLNTLHSGGKGIYRQSIDGELVGTLLAEAPSFTFEEGIGRLYEDIIGRSRGFCGRFCRQASVFVPELKAMGADGLYRELNTVRPTALRVSADELTYLIHIIIRYELERQLIEGKLRVCELPGRWNELYGDYLGVRPASDAEGILQDVHWAAGYLGYFPTYVVANLESAQVAQALSRGMGPLDEFVAEGDFNAINGWLTEHIYRWGALYSSSELLQRATGQKLSPVHYMDYLRNKYSEVYGVSL